MKDLSRLYKNRIRVFFLMISVGFLLLFFRMAWVQIVRGNDYKEMAIAQQTTDIPIMPKRGDIVDRKGHQLATSAVVYSIWIRPKEIRKELKPEKLDQVCNDIAVILNMSSEDVKKDVNSKEQLIPLKKHVEKSVAEKIRALQIYGFEIVEETRRFYPLGDFASTVLGSVNDDGVGRSGIEQEYNSYLTGVMGRMVKDSDIQGNPLSYGEKRYYHAEDGATIKVTIDEMLQHYLEETLEEGRKKYKSYQTWGLVMNPQNGEILALAKNPTFDPNSPFTPSQEKDKKEFEKIPDKEKSDAINKLWRNPLISDTYEPGSTFKLLVASAALESGVANPNTNYNCSGAYNVDGINLHCWYHAGHGSLTLAKAVGVSCNPAHIEMAMQLGIDRFYDYLNLYGITGKTGIDLPAEALSQVKKKEDVRRIDLATMGFGQGIALTPIEILTAISSIGNGGYIVKPHIMSEIIGADGKVIKKFQDKKVRQVLSKETTAEMRKIMEDEVEIYGGQTAKINGYKIGGKTGTANIPDGKGGYESSREYTSFVCLAPINDPKLAVLIVVDGPSGNYGSTTAAPMVKNFLEKALPYLNVPRKIDEKNKELPSEYQYVPQLVGMKFGEARAILESYGLKAELKPASKEKEEVIKEMEIVDQYPKAGKKINRKEKVVLYRE